MIQIVRAGAEDLETVIEIKGLALRLSMRNIKMSMIPT